MTISASDVKKLRDMTGAGMMDAKKALSESSGDFDKAVKFLREKGLADSKNVLIKMLIKEQLATIYIISKIGQFLEY